MQLVSVPLCASQSASGGDRGDCDGGDVVWAGRAAAEAGGCAGNVGRGEVGGEL